jgi:hypothetical protein
MMLRRLAALEVAIGDLSYAKRHHLTALASSGDCHFAGVRPFQPEADDFCVAARSY